MKNINIGGVTQISGETRIEDMQSRNVLEKQYIQKIFGTTTPNVLNKVIFELTNSAPITVTDFLNGAPGQRIYLLGDGNTTIENGTLIFTNTGADKLLDNNKIYTFTFFSSGLTHKWVEDE